MINVLPTVKIKVNILPKFPPKIVPVIVPKIVSNALSDVVPSMPTILSLQEKEHKLFSLVSDAFVPVTRKCLLSTILVKKDMQDKLNSVVINMKNIAINTHYLLNLHLLRALNDPSMTLPDLSDQNLYSHIGRLVTHLNGKLDSPNGVSSDLLQSAKLFYSLLPNNYLFPERRSIGLLLNTLLARIRTEVANHLDTNIESRFAKYLKVKYDISDRYERSYIVRKILYGNSGYKSKFDNALRSKLIINKYSRFVKFAGKRIPQGTKPSKDPEVFIQLYHLIQKTFEEAGTASFSLLPLTGDFIPEYVTLTSSLLPDLFNLFTKETKASFTAKGNEKLWSMLLRKNKFPDCNGYFGNHISTDGYGVSILFYSLPKGFGLSWNEFQELLLDDKIQVTEAYVAIIAAQVAKLKSEKKVQVVKKDEICPFEYENFSHYYGNDPGGRYLFTINTDDNRGYVRGSAEEYHHLTKKKEYQKFLNNRKDNIAELKSLNKYSLKQWRLDKYQTNLTEWLRCQQSLLMEYTQLVYREKRFTAYGLKQKAFNYFKNKIIGTKNPSQIIIGWGDGGTNKKGIKGPKMPNKEFMNYMKRFVSVTDIDEHRTTKCCNRCGSEMKKVCNSRSPNEKFKREIYEITRCNNNVCRITYERDKNASINIRKLLIHKLRREERPAYLQRQKKEKAEEVLIKAKAKAKANAKAKIKITLKNVGVSVIPKIDKKTSKE